MIEILKGIARFLFYSIWVIILLDAMILALAGCVFVTKTVLKEWTVKNLFSQAQPKKSKEN